MSVFAFSRSFSNELLCLLSGMIPFIPYKNMLLVEGDVGIFGFGHFLGRFFGFCTEQLRFLSFVGHCGFRFFGFLAPGFLAKIKQIREGPLENLCEGAGGAAGEVQRKNIRAREN